MDEHVTKKEKVSNRPAVPTSEEFTRTLGQIAWLMTQSKPHKRRDIELIEAHVAAPLMFKQVRVFTKGKQPLAAIIWAYASEEVKEHLSQEDYRMRLEDWRSGPDIVIVDCISPFISPQIFVDQFLSEVMAAKANKPSDA